MALLPAVASGPLGAPGPRHPHPLPPRPLPPRRPPGHAPAFPAQLPLPPPSCLAWLGDLCWAPGVRWAPSQATAPARTPGCRPGRRPCRPWSSDIASAGSACSCEVRAPATPSQGAPGVPWAPHHFGSEPLRPPLTDHELIESRDRGDSQHTAQVWPREATQGRVAMGSSRCGEVSLPYGCPSPRRGAPGLRLTMNE